MRSNIQKWGNSLAVRIPKSLAEQAGLLQGSVVLLKLVNDRIQIEPVPSEEYTLQDLLKGVTHENVHREVDFGPAQGREAW